MTVEQALEQLLPYRSKVSTEALHVIRDNWREAEPKLLEELDRCIVQPVESDSAALFLYALYLCAEMRCEAAFERYIRILRLPNLLIRHMIGDILTEAMGKMLARTCAGHSEELKAIVEDEAVNEFARATALDAMERLVYSGDLDRQEMERYCIELLTGKLEKRHSYIWNAASLTAMDMDLESALPSIEIAYRNGWTDPMVCSLEEIQDSLRDPSRGFESLAERANAEMFETDREMKFFVKNWGETQEKDPTELLREPRKQRLGQYGPAYNNVGRNAPCPCGSGKKFKKCCIDKEVPADAPERERDVAPANIADEWIIAGYYYLENNSEHRTLECWWQGWREVKELLPDEIHDPEADECIILFPGSVYFGKWLEDYQALIEENMKRDADVVSNGLQFCVQVRQRFPEMDTLSANNLIETTAYLLTLLGRSEEAFTLLQQMIEQQPKTAQGYAVWSSLLTAEAGFFNLRSDVDRARQLLQQALQHATDCEDWNIDARLRELGTVFNS